MTLPLTLYKGLTSALSPFIPLLYHHRLSKGKERRGSVHQRLAKNLPARPAGTLVWMHGASIGESKLLLGLAQALAAERPDLHFLFTSQTLSSARIVEQSLPQNAIQQMAPIDTAPATKRFIEHWTPDLCIFAEGEVWPNLLEACAKSQAKTALVNARMTAKSLDGWKRVSKTAQKLFSTFDAILAANASTASGLSALSLRGVPNIGNLKAALSLKSGSDARAKPDDALLDFAKDRTVILGASTHAGEEALLLEALARLPDQSCLIIAPRHPGRAEDIEALIKATGKTYIRRSKGGAVTQATDILLADTFGEMNIWYALADSVYLGGAHAPGIGGHSPLEPLSFGLPIITGPHTDNFTETHEALAGQGWTHIVNTAADLAQRVIDVPRPDKAKLEVYFNAHKTTLARTLETLTALLPERPS